MKRMILLTAARRYWRSRRLASAHPLGNFTINRFARVEVAGDQLYVRYVVDMAEIPTLQHVPVRIGALHVTGRRAAGPAPRGRTALAHPRGAAGLRTTRFQAILAGPTVSGQRRSLGRRSQLRRPHRLEGDRLRRHDAARRPTSCGPIRRICSRARSTSREPARSWADERRAAHPAHGPGARRTRPDRRLGLRLADRPSASEPRRDSRLARACSLLGSRARALSGTRQDDRHRLSRRLARHAAARCAARARSPPRPTRRACSHSGAITLLLSQWIVPDRLYPWLDLSAGLMVVASARPCSPAERGTLARTGTDITTTITTTTRATRTACAACSPSASPAASCLAPRRSSCCSAAISLHRVGFGMPLVVRVQRRPGPRDHLRRARRRPREGRVRTVRRPADAWPPCCRPSARS